MHTGTLCNVHMSQICFQVTYEVLAHSDKGKSAAVTVITMLDHSGDTCYTPGKLWCKTSKMCAKSCGKFVLQFLQSARHI